jgi:hypothetical protein
MTIWVRAFAPETWATWSASLVGIGVLYIYWRTLTAIEVSADAANRSAEAVVNAERAWILANIEFVPGFGGLILTDGTEGPHTWVSIRFTFTNQGKTPAWVDERRARFVIIDHVPPTPDLEATELIKDGADFVPLAAPGILATDDSISAEGRDDSNDVVKVSLIYGVVRYWDVYGNRRQTTFGYRITPDRKLRRLGEYAAYNQST